MAARGQAGDLLAVANAGIATVQRQIAQAGAADHGGHDNRRIRSPRGRRWRGGRGRCDHGLLRRRRRRWRGRRRELQRRGLLRFGRARRQGRARWRHRDDGGLSRLWRWRRGGCGRCGWRGRSSRRGRRRRRRFRCCGRIGRRDCRTDRGFAGGRQAGDVLLQADQCVFTAWRDAGTFRHEVRPATGADGALLLGGDLSVCLRCREGAERDGQSDRACQSHAGFPPNPCRRATIAAARPSRQIDIFACKCLGRAAECLGFGVSCPAKETFDGDGCG